LIGKIARATIPMATLVPGHRELAESGGSGEVGAAQRAYYRWAHISRSLLKLALAKVGCTTQSKLDQSASALEPFDGYCRLIKDQHR
jgi:hypothetical protein